MKKFAVPFLFSVGVVASLMAASFWMAPQAKAVIDIKREYESALLKSGISGTQERTPGGVVGAIGNTVTVILGLIGVATFVLVVYAGALWILAAGNEDKVAQAKGILKGAVIGLVIVFSSYTIVNFALTKLQEALSGPVASPRSGSESPAGR